MVIALGVAGGLLDQWVKPVRRLETFSAKSLASSPGAGTLWGGLGGFRALTADFLWLRMHFGWEARDFPATQALIGLTSAVDGRPLYFWLNGARIVAYDFPAWRIEAEGGYGTVTAERQRTIEIEQGRAGIRRLEEGRRAHPESAALWIEQGNIELNRLKNPAAAAENYRRAAHVPGAPPHAARLYGELLRQLGKKQEAYSWLRALHPQLRPDDEASASDLVLHRIRDLERELAVSPTDVYEPRLE